MRAVALSAVKAGITRLREKGGASPDSLFDLLNGYVTAARSIKMRPGSELDHALPPGATKGLVLFRGKFVVFASEAVDPGDPDYRVEILKHAEAGSVATLDDIRFATPFLGYLYVVARWSDGKIFHYWLQESSEWEPLTNYSLGQTVLPTVPNGYAYRANRLGTPGEPWEPLIPRAIGDVVEPTVANGFDYIVVDVIGANPSSGTTEPDWPTVEGEQIVEQVDGAAVANPGSGNGGTQVPPDVEDRYGSGKKNGVEP